MTRKIPIDVALEPDVARTVVGDLVQVNEHSEGVAVTLCPARPHVYSLLYGTREEAEHVAGVVRRLAWLAIEDYLRALAGCSVVVLGNQALPAECHPDTPRQGPLPTSEAQEVEQMAELLRQPRELTSARPVDEWTQESKVAGPDLFAGELSAMGRLLIDVAPATPYAYRTSSRRPARRRRPSTRLWQTRSGRAGYGLTLWYYARP
jgi:hypothetical protein